ncbi:hypothetical protein Kisp01_40790 [Kineosporia sp. NBRC 101677]|uniref:DUF4334 domain-containing protein n=1 Tax=Kineosporia sp. NBRC 101677 TaxID=3032197 RepID=UPI0024A1D15B|nr:DUF4334 domain-containing protein [Kineosporia sp. NBRC 101677]GLY17064.1 hypothetical protein Kisp01_40790 [Kineosporia sp. NBRC 101677]
MTDASQRLAELLTGSTTDQALELFDSLPAVGLDQLIGQWRGTGLRTGHVFDGQLEAAGWRGKNFHSTEDVDPLVFEQGGRPFRVNPSLLPLGAGVRYPQLLGRPAVMRTSGRLLPLLKTSKPQARLRMVEYRGVVTGSMVYDALPIIDHFRPVDAGTLLGAMDMRGLPEPFMFVLRRSAD